MKKKISLLASLLLACTPFYADEVTTDSLRLVDIEEVVVIATPKENKKLRELPLSVSLLSQQDIHQNRINSVKRISGLVPNIYIPDYGSRLTTAIYIRGIGSRINTPSVGLYVDNIPYVDKSAFDFNFFDIERIDVLRGPQNTLYGRNTMGGLIKVHTKSPFNYQGTDFQIEGATYNNYNASVKHYHRVSNQFAFSTGLFYEHEGGFFKNAAQNDKRMDKLDGGGGQARFIYLPTDKLKFDLSLNYSYSDQGGYAYGEYDKQNNIYMQPAYNDDASYRRSLFNTGLNIEYQGENFILSAVTGYQNMLDRMMLDQDFTAAPIFTLEHKQKSNTLSEEIVFKSKPNRRWEWTTGAFAFHQWLNTTAPVVFKKGGLDMIEGFINQAMEGSPMRIDILNDTMPVDGKYQQPTTGLALFHQSTLNDLFVDGLSLTAGIRMDYEKMKVTHDTRTSMTMQAYMMDKPFMEPVTSAPVVEGVEKVDFLEFMPKFALKYDFGQRNNVYASVSRGFRSGGYNIQMFSGIIEEKLQDRPGGSGGAPGGKPGNTGGHPGGMPPAAGTKAGHPGGQPAEKPETPQEDNIADIISYNPEFSWNYEIGSHLTLWEGRLWLDLAAYLMDTKDQQISTFEEKGLGRITVNAGKSRSYGFEAALRTQLTDKLSANVSWGYTHATFREYLTKERQGKELVTIDYQGKRVPFVPTHTFNIGAQYNIPMATNAWIDNILLCADYTGAGRIYWTEANDVSQSFYALLNGRVSFIKGRAEVDLWTRNALNKDYASFYFESSGTGSHKGFMQKGRPVQVGLSMRCRF